MQIGDVVVYHDTKGKAHNALVTTAWGDDKSAINLAYVSGDDAERDQYGRQTKRESSVTHVSRSGVHGRYWRKPDEEPNEYAAPSAA